MAAMQRSTVVGVFEDRRHADQAVAELKKAGFRDDQIGVAMRHAEASAGTVTRHKVSREIATQSFARSFHMVQSDHVG
jgi:hypothetical protein